MKKEELLQQEVEKFSKCLDEIIEAQNGKINAPELIAYRGASTIKRHPSDETYRVHGSSLYSCDASEELKPEYDSHKSFYKKAYIGFDEATSSMTLYSYDTAIMTYYIKKRRLVFEDGDSEGLYGLYSATTRRHVYEMLRQWFNLATAQYVYACIMSDC